MTALQTSQYHGYDTVANRQWSSWCACIYPTRADLPILPSSILRTLACQKSDAIAEAKPLSIEFSHVVATLQRRAGHGNSPDAAKISGCQRHPI